MPEVFLDGWSIWRAASREVLGPEEHWVAEIPPKRHFWRVQVYFLRFLAFESKVLGATVYSENKSI